MAVTKSLAAYIVSSSSFKRMHGGILYLSSITTCAPLLSDNISLSLNSLNSSSILSS